MSATTTKAPPPYHENPRLYNETYQHRRFTLRFNEPIEAHEAPAIYDETRARLDKMNALRADALDAAEREPDPHERNAARMIYEGAGLEAANLTEHLTRVEALLR